MRGHHKDSAFSRDDAVEPLSPPPPSNSSRKRPRETCQLSETAGLPQVVEATNTGSGCELKVEKGSETITLTGDYVRPQLRRATSSSRLTVKAALGNVRLDFFFEGKVLKSRPHL